LNKQNAYSAQFSNVLAKAKKNRRGAVQQTIIVSFLALRHWQSAIAGLETDLRMLRRQPALTNIRARTLAFTTQLSAHRLINDRL